MLFSVSKWVTIDVNVISLKVAANVKGESSLKSSTQFKALLKLERRIYSYGSSKNLNIFLDDLYTSVKRYTNWWFIEVSDVEKNYFLLLFLKNNFFFSFCFFSLLIQEEEEEEEEKEQCKNLRLLCRYKKNCVSNHKHDETEEIILELVKRRGIWI